MNQNSLVFSVYSRRYKAANDDGPDISVQRPIRSDISEVETTLRGGWDPFEVWRTRIRNPSKRDPRGR